MEYLNKIILQGRVGSIKLHTIGSTVLARFAMVTEDVNKDTMGNIVIDCCWHRIFAMESKGIDATMLNSLKTGDIVHVEGRLRMQRFVDSSGNEREVYEVMANQVKIL